ncbi:MAG: PqqD family protein [Nitrososphaerota archaeon]|nr:PqqD family protein [Aigarchaeota archaeon]MDW8076145.1 PqqD family protein [Nitrososphaerota archaeon]
MESIRITRKGTALRDEEGKLLLVNEDNEAYIANEIVVYIWNLCDGKTLDELTKEIAEAVNRDTGEVREALSELIGRLKEAKLVEYAAP